MRQIFPHHAVLTLVTFCGLGTPWVLNGCQKSPSQEDRPNSSTIATLSVWSEVITEVHYGERDWIGRFSTIDEILEAWVEWGILIQSEATRLRRDWWGNSFHFHCSTTDGVLIVKIRSDGADGISQDGQGDDVLLELTLPINPMFAKARLRGVKNGKLYVRELSPMVD